MNCKVINDLLPLYHDEVISEESRELIEEHLKSCAECRTLLEDIHENVRTKNVPGVEQPMASGFKVLKKRLHRKSVFNIAISIICAVAAVSALTYGMFFYEMPTQYSEVTRTITQPIHSALDFITDVRGHNSITVFQMGDALYICYWDTFWTRYIARPNKSISLEIPAVPTAPEPPSALGSSYIPSVPEPPEAPNPLISISEEVTKVFYFEGNLSKFTHDDTAFSEAAAKAVLLWEK